MISELAEAFKRSVEATLEDKIAIAFSGGLDSTLIAQVAKNHAEVTLFTAGLEGSDDMEVSVQVAEVLGLPLVAHTFSEEEILKLYETCYGLVPGELTKVELLVPVHRVAEMARLRGFEALLFGSGSEELFAGYDRYFTYKEEGKDVDTILKEEFSTLKDREILMIKKVCRKFSVDARFPFYNRDLASLAFQIPIEDKMAERELKKCVLREVGKLLGAPELALQRKKKAMQYGSGVHRILMRHKDEINAKFPGK
jgi:asparagine synthase (glutamine-hydrolysing)